MREENFFWKKDKKKIKKLTLKNIEALRGFLEYAEHVVTNPKQPEEIQYYICHAIEMVIDAINQAKDIEKKEIQ